MNWFVDLDVFDIDGLPLQGDEFIIHPIYPGDAFELMAPIPSETDYLAELKRGKSSRKVVRYLEKTSDSPVTCITTFKSLFERRVMHNFTVREACLVLGVSASSLRRIRLLIGCTRWTFRRSHIVGIGRHSQIEAI